MHPPERLSTPVGEILAMAEKMVDNEVDEETDARSIMSQSATWTIIPLKHAERVTALKMSQTLAIQAPPGMKNELATTAVSQDTSNLTAST